MNKINIKLFGAIKDGHYEKIEQLITQGADVNANDGFINPLFNSALMIAAKYNQQRCLELLINHGADLHYTNIHKMNALHVAVNFEANNCITPLINHGIDASIGDNDQYLPLHYAAKYGNTEQIKLLIAATKDLERKQNNGYTALHLAVRFNHPNAITLLVQHQANIQCVDTQGYSTLMEASCQNNFEMVKLLVAIGVDIHYKNDNDDNALLLATKSAIEKELENPSIVKYLLDHGADVNHCDKHERHALWFATIGSCSFDARQELIAVILAHNPKKELVDQAILNAQRCSINVGNIFENYLEKLKLHQFIHEGHQSDQDLGLTL